MLEIPVVCCVTKMGTLSHYHMTTSRISSKSGRGSRGQVRDERKQSSYFKHTLSIPVLQACVVGFEVLGCHLVVDFRNSIVLNKAKDQIVMTQIDT